MVPCLKWTVLEEFFQTILTSIKLQVDKDVEMEIKMKMIGKLEE